MCDVDQTVNTAEVNEYTVRMIINAGISQVIIRRDNDTYDTIDVADWVAHDDVLDGQTGY